MEQKVEEQKPATGTGKEAQPLAETATFDSSGLDQLLLYFARYPLQELQPRGTTGTVRTWISGNALCLAHNERVTRALYKLTTEGFLGAPVVDERGRLCGMLDLLDLVAFTVDLFGESKRQPTEWQEFFEKEKLFWAAHVSEVMSKLGTAFAQSVRKGFSVLQAMEIFARTGLHRVPVVDADNVIVGICTQSMIVSLLSQALGMMKDAKQQKVKSIHGHLNPQLYAVKETELAINGFRMLRDKGVLGIAVVNQDGKLVDSLSSRDLRGIGTNAAKFRRLYESVATFKAEVRKEYAKQTPPQPLTVTQDSTLEDVINLLDDGNIHRVFEIDAEGKPTHVISQKDVIAWVLRLSGVLKGAAQQGQSQQQQQQQQQQQPLKPEASAAEKASSGSAPSMASTAAAAQSQSSTMPMSESSDELSIQPNLAPKKQEKPEQQVPVGCDVPASQAASGKGEAPQTAAAMDMSA